MKNKKVLKIVVSITVIILIGVILFILNYNKDNQEQYANKISTENLPEEISVEQAVEKGYFVITVDKVYNKNVLDRFIANTEMNSKNRIADKIRIIVYNIDYYPTIYNLEYFDKTNTNEKIENELDKKGYILTTDTTRNNYTSREITVNDNIPGIFYGITLKEEKGISSGSICLSVYGVIDYIKPDQKQYEEIEIARYALDAEVINKDNTLEINPNEVTTIDIETALVNDEKKATLNQEEIYEMFKIFNNLNFSKETCDGLPTYVIKINDKDEKCFKSYGLEVFENSYHITARENGEAVLSSEQKNELDKIINKYFY